MISLHRVKIKSLNRTVAIFQESGGIDSVTIMSRDIGEKEEIVWRLGTELATPQGEWAHGQVQIEGFDQSEFWYQIIVDVVRGESADGFFSMDDFRFVETGDEGACSVTPPEANPNATFSSTTTMSTSTAQCAEGQFQCLGDHSCITNVCIRREKESIQSIHLLFSIPILQNQICDFKQQCGDGSDEESCPSGFTFDDCQDGGCNWYEEFPEDKLNWVVTSSKKNKTALAQV